MHLETTLVRSNFISVLSRTIRSMDGVLKFFLQNPQTKIETRLRGTPALPFRANVVTGMVRSQTQPKLWRSRQKRSKRRKRRKLKKTQQKLRKKLPKRLLQRKLKMIDLRPRRPRRRKLRQLKKPRKKAKMEEPRRVTQLRVKKVANLLMVGPRANDVCY